MGAATQLDPDRDARITDKRARRDESNIAMRARVLFAEGASIEQIADALHVHPSRIKRVLERSKRALNAHHVPHPEGLPELVSIGAVRRMFFPVPSHETIRRWLQKSGIPVFAMNRGKHRSDGRYIPLSRLGAFLAECHEPAGNKPASRHERRRKREADARARAGLPPVPERAHDPIASAAHARAAKTAQQAEGAQGTWPALDPAVASLLPSERNGPVPAPPSPTRQAAEPAPTSMPDPVPTNPRGWRDL